MRCCPATGTEAAERQELILAIPKLHNKRPKVGGQAVLGRQL